MKVHHIAEDGCKGHQADDQLDYHIQILHLFFYFIKNNRMELKGLTNLRTSFTNCPAGLSHLDTAPGFENDVFF